MRLVLVATLVTLCSTACDTAKTCTPQSCSGCCSEAGECLTGGENSACGNSGNMCVNCAATAQTCGDRVCISSGSGGGGTSTGGGGGMSIGGGGGESTGGGGGESTGGGGGESTGGGGGESTGGGGGESTGGGGGESTGGGGGESTGGGGGMSTGGGGGMGGGGGTPDAGCPRALGAADRPRYVVASHAYTSGGNPDNLFEVFSLSPTGALATGQLFRMGPTELHSKITFTPDGVVGIALETQRTFGVFTLDSTGTPTVVHAAFAPGFSPNSILMLPSGNSFLATDFNTEANGGGLYQVDIGCDGTLANVRKVLAGSGAAVAAFLPGHALLAVGARNLTGSPTMQDLHLVELADAGPTVRASASGFPPPDAVPVTLTVSADGRWLAAPDMTGDRLAIFERQGTTLTARQVLTAANPLAIAFAPAGSHGVLINTLGEDDFRRVDFSGGTFSVATAPMTYTHGQPEVPGVPSMIDRGALAGRVLLPEARGVRQLQFEADGGGTDVAMTTASGTGLGQVLGSLGVQP